ADEKSAYNNVQVGDGPQQREIGFPISTDNASWVFNVQFLFSQALAYCFIFISNITLTKKYLNVK
ncbi:hypothetical protein AAGX44_13250, partial [Staphylococcus aureus]